MNVLPRHPALARQIKALRAVDEKKQQRKDFPVSALGRETPERQANPWGSAGAGVGKDCDAEADPMEWEPVLLISNRAISIEKLGVKVQGDSYAWIYNMLASLFSNILRDTICRALVDLIGSSSSVLLLTVNGLFASKWDLVQRVMPFDLAAVPVCTAWQFMSLVGSEPDDEAEAAARASVLPAREWTIKFCEEGPLGLKLDLLREDSRVDTVTNVVVASVGPGSQGEKACAALGWPKSFMESSTVLTVNGARLYSATKERVYGLLSGRRPLFLHIRLTDQAYGYLRTHTALMAKAAAEEESKYVTVVFKEGPLGMVLTEVPTRGVVVIRAFARGAGDAMLQAEASRKCKVGLVVLGINGKVLLGRTLPEIQTIFQRTARPATVLFARDLQCADAVSVIKIKELFM